MGVREDKLLRTPPQCFGLVQLDGVFHLGNISRGIGWFFFFKEGGERLMNSILDTLSWNI